LEPLATVGDHQWTVPGKVAKGEKPMADNVCAERLRQD
jgi:hypothetical protein